MTGTRGAPLSRSSLRITLTMRSFEEHDVVNTVYRVADGAETLDFLFRRGEYADPRMTRHIQSWSGEPFSRGRQGGPD